jgi:soluble lytic murein transglycosylase
MKFFFLFFLFIFNSRAQSNGQIQTYEEFLTSSALTLSRSDHIIGENIISLMKLIQKGYVNKDILKKVQTQTSKSKHFQPFIPWLESIKEIINKTDASALIQYCSQYSQKKEDHILERILFRMAGNLCRERALESISRQIEKTNLITDEATEFIKQNLKFYLTKKNKKNFSFFMQSMATRPEILKKLSHEVTAYSVQHEIVPSQEVLQDILINEQITKLIQDKGFNLVQPKNIFYAEYGKLIEQSYKALDNDPSAEKVKEHLSFLKNYLELNQDHLPVGMCLSRLNDFAKAVFRAKFDDLARDIFKYIVKKNNKEIYEDALFFYLWTYLSKGKYEEALSLAKKYDLVGAKAKVMDPKLKFWIGHLYEELKETDEALKYYEDIIKNSPLSFYAIMGVKRVQHIKPGSDSVKFYISSSNKKNQPISFDAKTIDQDYLSSLIRLKAWAKIDSQKLMRIELKRLKNHSMPSFIVTLPTQKQLEVRSDLHLINAKILLESKNYLSSFKYLYEVLEKKEVFFQRQLLEQLYPMPYIKDLVMTIKKDKLDPIVVLSLIRQESVFNPLARSRVGARGLMQIMPTTAKRMKRSIRDKHLIDPKTNIELGTKYLNNLMNRYEGNLVYVLAAYNAGESRVDRWKISHFDSDETILKNIEAIPFLETRNYVKLIFRNIFFYKLLEGKSELTDTSEPNKIFDVKLGFKR